MLLRYLNLKKIQNLPNTRIGKVLNFLRWFRGYAITPPLFVELFLTDKCNLSCSYCYQLSREKRDSQDMTLKDAIKIERNIRPRFFIKPRIYIFGGEPTCNKDFFKILEYFSRKKYKVFFITNALNLSE